MSEAAVDHAVELLGRRFGLRIDAVARRRILRAIEDGADPDALERLVDLVTVQEGAFFRHPAHFEVLADHLRSPALARLAPADRVIWSAGCGDGEEAWSLAIVLEELGLVEWRVLATDASNAALERARAGIYGERRLADLDPGRRARFLRELPGGQWEVDPGLRDRVGFQQHNLAGGRAPAGAAGCPIVFCRNVLIYLLPGNQRRVLDDLRAQMPDDGLLVLGAAEAIGPGDPAFAPERRAGSFVYRPRTAAGPPAAGPPPSRPPVRRRRSGKPRPAEPSAAHYATEGERLAAQGDHRAAAEAFRRAAYLQPDDPLHHVRLGLALEAAGDSGAERAFRAGRSALRRAGDVALEGWSPGELDRLLAEKL